MTDHEENCPMREANRWWLMLALLMTVSGCDTNRPSTRPSLSDNGRFMDIWSTYTHCYRSEDLDAMRVDAQRLSGAANTIDSTEVPKPLESREPVHSGSIGRLSVDPAEMAASCALHTGQVAQNRGLDKLAREMFQMVITNFPQPPYRYYAAEARRGLDRLDTTNPVTFSGHGI